MQYSFTQHRFLTQQEVATVSCCSYINAIEYFVAGVRKKVDDLCGCNEELIRPLKDVFAVPNTISNNNSSGTIEGKRNCRNHEVPKPIPEERSAVNNATRNDKSHSV